MQALHNQTMNNEFRLLPGSGFHVEVTPLGVLEKVVS